MAQFLPERGPPIALWFSWPLRSPKMWATQMSHIQVRGTTFIWWSSRLILLILTILKTYEAHSEEGLHWRTTKVQLENTIWVAVEFDSSEEVRQSQWLTNICQSNFKTRNIHFKLTFSLQLGPQYNDCDLNYFGSNNLFLHTLRNYSVIINSVIIILITFLKILVTWL